MAGITPSYALVNPSLVFPDLIVNYQQASGAFNAIGTGNPRAMLGPIDQYVYMRALDVRTDVTASQTNNGNEVPSVAFDTRMISVPTYLYRARAIYDHHDINHAAAWNVALPEANRLGMRQGIFQQLRNGLLYGVKPSGGEGLMNTTGATEVTLPADTDGNTTVVTYDAGQLASWLLTQILALRTRTMQMGRKCRINILGPQRTLGQMEMVKVVQLTSYQRPGGGVATVAGQINAISDDADVEITWSYDDTLIGAGAGGTDAVIITMPELDNPQNGAAINTNEFAKISPSTSATSTMLVDMVAPREIPTPIAGGAIDVLSEMRSTPGWVIRPEAITIASLAYE